MLQSLWTVAAPAIDLGAGLSLQCFRERASWCPDLTFALCYPAAFGPLIRIGKGVAQNRDAQTCRVYRWIDS